MQHCKVVVVAAWVLGTGTWHAGWRSMCRDQVWGFEWHWWVFSVLDGHWQLGWG